MRLNKTTAARALSAAVFLISGVVHSQDSPPGSRHEGIVTPGVTASAATNGASGSRGYRRTFRESQLTPREGADTVYVVAAADGAGGSAIPADPTTPAATEDPARIDLPGGGVMQLPLPGIETGIPGQERLFPPERIEDAPIRLIEPISPAPPMLEPELEPEPEPAAPVLRPPPPVPWNLTDISSPLFGTAEVAEFTRKATSEGSRSLRPHFALSAVYDSNIFIQQDNVVEDFIIALSPGVRLQLGNSASRLYFALDYTGSGVLFLDNSSQNSFDSNGTLDFIWRQAKLTLSLHMGVGINSGTSVEAGQRVRQAAFFATVSAHYELDEKFSWDLNTAYQPISYQDLLGSKSVGVQGYLNYNYSPKLTLGLGGVLGFTTVDEGSDQTAEEASIRASYVATAKFTVSGNFGIAFRQFSDDAEQTVTPVYGLAASWAVREGTTLSLSARRSVFTSAVLVDQNYVASEIGLTLNQRLTDRYSVFVTAGYDRLTYTSAGADVSASRVDNYGFARIGVQWNAFAWGSFGIFYEYNRNASAGEGANSFSRSRAGLQASVVF